MSSHEYSPSVTTSILAIPSDIIIEFCKYLGVIDVNSLYGTCFTFKKYIEDDSQYIYKKCQHIQPHGIARTWWNGEKTIPKSETAYIEGKRQGQYKLWHPNGQISDCCFYRNNKLDGEYKKWSANGQIYQHSFYRNDELHGEYKVWHENGQMSGCRFYRNGELDGEYKKWHPNGQISVHRFYRNGELDGECKEWHENGQLSKNYFYRNDELDGKYKQWNRFGIMTSHHSYRNGHLKCDLTWRAYIVTKIIHGSKYL